MNERERLMIELNIMYDTITSKNDAISKVADFILNDRARIVNILYKVLSKRNAKDFIVGKDYYMHVNSQDVREALEFIKLSGVKI